ncbi:MAG TPA: hypothetical protein VG500_08635 [Gemmatimonadales bacterium]|nr:hypothetical protein [Gemmatimonadales bacterium]
MEETSARTEEQDLELWKHFAGFGGEDKNRMVTIASWLLGFSAALLAFAAQRLVDPEACKATDHKAAGIWRRDQPLVLQLRDSLGDLHADELGLRHGFAALGIGFERLGCYKSAAPPRTTSPRTPQSAPAAAPPARTRP